MKSLFFIILFIVLLSCSKVLCAQDRTVPGVTLGLGGRLSVPVGSNLMNKTGLLFPVLEGEWRLSPLFATGISVTYGSTSEHGFTRDRYAGSLIDGRSFREYSALTLLLQWRWYMWGKRDYRLQPYFLLAGGADLTRYKITGEQINSSRIRGWSGVLMSEFGGRYALGAARRFAVDLRCGYRYGGLSWKLMDIRRDNRVVITLGLVVNL